MDKIETFKKIVEESDNIVFFGGAGVSTESGIPDFRSVDGLYNQKYDYPPETILSYSFFLSHPKEFYKFHRDKLLIKNVQPNITHLKLAQLEHEGKLRAVVTQNIDNLHQAAGSKNVLELHGSVERNYCMKCGKKYPKEFVDEAKDVPTCTCGGIVRPDVVLYEESLDSDVMSAALHYISDADVLIVGGTSLNVYPAAGLINVYKGNKLILINKTATPYDHRANLVINEGLGSVFSQI